MSFSLHPSGAASLFRIFASNCFYKIGKACGARISFCSSVVTASGTQAPTAFAHSSQTRSGRTSVVSMHDTS